MLELTRAQALALGYCLSMWAQQCTCDAVLTVDVAGEDFHMTFKHAKGCQAVLRANAFRN